MSDIWKSWLPKVVTHLIAVIGGAALAATFLIFTAGNAEATESDAIATDDSAIVVDADLVSTDTVDPLVIPLDVKDVEVVGRPTSEADSKDSGAGSTASNSGSEGTVPITDTEEVSQKDAEPKGVKAWFSGVWATVWGTSTED